MPHYTDSQLNKLQKLLNEREKALQAHLRVDEVQRTDFADEAGNAPDPGDTSFADLSIDLEQASIERDTLEMRAIDTARERIHAGTYGQCIECGAKIPLDRLMVQPMAARCMPCQEAFEHSLADGLVHPVM
ncbi:MAG: hypothetical protein NVSMB6_24790 [Burkholderiaceae bacterium]